MQVFAVKAKFTFPFGRQVLSNYYNFAGILCGACLGIFVIYTPPLHVVFGGSFHLSPLYWLIPVAFGVLLLAWTSIRVLLMRKGIEQARVKDIKGLMMCMGSSLNCVKFILTIKYSPHDENNEHAFPYWYKIDSGL